MIKTKKLEFSYDNQEFFKFHDINLKKKENLSFQDLVAFAFWIRKKNILKLSDHYVLKDRMVGYGLALHISPSNVPMNFAYSLVFGLLSGNNNILRLPSKKFNQTNILCNIIKKILLQ